MATLDFRGFSESPAISDYLTTGLIQAFSSQAPISNLTIGSNGMFGDNFLNLYCPNTTGIRGTMSWPTATLQPFIGFRCRIGTLIGDGANDARHSVDVCLIDTLGNAQLTLSINEVDGSMRLFRGGWGFTAFASSFYGSARQIGSAPAGTFILGNVWQYVEIGAVISTANGAATVRINGNVVITVANTPTVSDNTNPSINSVSFQVIAVNSNNTAQVQHFYVNDNNGPPPLNGFLGDVRVAGQAYAAISGAPAFVPSGAATNVAVCNTIPPVPGTVRNVSTTVGDTDTYTVQAVPPSTTTVYAVGVRTLAAKDTAGTRSLQNKLTSGATTASGVVVSLGTAPLYVRDNFGTDPGTAGPWTVAAVNALKPGYTS